VKPVYFATPDAFRAWLEAHHGEVTELVVGFYKRGTGRPSLTWPESVDEALCFGWIDGVRKSVDAERYQIRFTPRKAGSIWSRINVDKVAALTALGKMRPAGLAAFAARKAHNTAIYSYEREHATFDAEQEKAFRADAKAWKWWHACAPGYRRVATHWVTSAKQEATRARRLATLIADCAAGVKIAPLRERKGVK
jgi:uncharacterized protein YdeI (YjbR/CyaY-like superfamily)